MAAFLAVAGDSLPPALRAGFDLEQSENAESLPQTPGNSWGIPDLLQGRLTAMGIPIDVFPR